MKKSLWGLAAWLLVVSSLSLQAGEKLYRIKLASSKDGVYGRPVTYQEVLPAPAPLEAPGTVQVPPVPPPADPPRGIQPVPEYVPAPAPPSALQPMPEYVPQRPVETYQTVELYPYVKYEDLDNVHPFAMKKIVAVKDPRAPKPLCGTCAPPSVFIMICVPPTGRFEFDVKRKDYSKVEYDYGKYEIEITSKNGIVYVDYDD